MLPINTDMHYHMGSIRGMDVTAKRPLVVTIGKDKTVHIWNYLDKTCEVVKALQEDPLR
jgi:WD40 repeat protein